MTPLKRKAGAPASAETFRVQLHVNSRDGIVYSYAPVAAADLDEARSAAHRLREQNRWGGSARWPLVTIHNDRGEWFPESRNAVIEQADGSRVPWAGR